MPSSIHWTQVVPMSCWYSEVQFTGRCSRVPFSWAFQKDQLWLSFKPKTGTASAPVKKTLKRPAVNIGSPRLSKKSVLYYHNWLQCYSFYAQPLWNSNLHVTKRRRKFDEGVWSVFFEDFFAPIGVVSSYVLMFLLQLFHEVCSPLHRIGFSKSFLVISLGDMFWVYKKAHQLPKEDTYWLCTQG